MRISVKELIEGGEVESGMLGGPAVERRVVVPVGHGEADEGISLSLTALEEGEALVIGERALLSPVKRGGIR